MAKYRDLNYGQQFPATYTDALEEFLDHASPAPYVRIKPGSSSVLQVPGPQGVTIQGKWRFNNAAVERAAITGATPRIQDVWVTTTANVFVAGAEEIDSTDYSFAVRLTEHGAAAPSGGGIVHTRKIAEAWWSGAEFLIVEPLAGDAVVPNLRRIGTRAQRIAATVPANTLWWETDQNALWIWGGAAWTCLESDVFEGAATTYTVATVVSPLNSVIVNHTGRKAIVELIIDATSSNFPLVELKQDGATIGKLPLSSTTPRPESLSKVVTTTFAAHTYTAELSGVGNFLGTVAINVAEI